MFESFESLFQYPAIVARHRGGPFAEARERFINHCVSQGLARATLQHYAQELLVVAERIDITVGGRGPRCTSRNRSTPNVPNTTASE